MPDYRPYVAFIFVVVTRVHAQERNLFALDDVQHPSFLLKDAAMDDLVDRPLRENIVIIDTVVWPQSDTMNPSSVGDTIASATQAVAKQIAKDGVLR